MRTRHIDLLHGRILPSLTGLALPIMATSMVQMAYNLTDMAWIGRVGSHAFTAVGAAGMFTWLSSGLVTLARMGGQVKVAHSLGEGSSQDAVEYGKGAIQLAIFLAVCFSAVTFFGAAPLISFFGLQNPDTVLDAQHYLQITGGLMVFSFLNQTMTGLYTAIGDSRTPFLANSTGLVINMILDPVLIFGLGPFPRMETIGAAAATVMAQAAVTLILVLRALQDSVLFDKIKIWKTTSWNYFRVILALGLPSALQSMLYSSISMVLTRMVASWGDAAIAVQRVGGQVESISWFMAEGFGAAMNAFTGQNFGARQYRRVQRSYWAALAVTGVWGTMTSLLLVFFGAPIFRIFIREPEVLPAGVSYLFVLGCGQMPMCLELMTVGALQGLGKTLSSSVITIVLTASRIPAAMVLSATALGLDGIWWALTVTSIAKGIVFVVYYTWTLHRLPKEDLDVGRKEQDSCGESV